MSTTPSPRSWKRSGERLESSRRLLLGCCCCNCCIGHNLRGVCAALGLSRYVTDRAGVCPLPRTIPAPMVSDAIGWYVVWTEPRAEKKVASRIAARGDDVWLPTYTTKRRWSDRWKEVVLPLFPGYLFARTSGGSWRELLQTPGVLTLVKDGGVPALLTDSFIHHLRSVVAAPESEAEPIESLPATVSTGDKVIVQEGPLAGLRGTVLEVRGARRLLIWVEAVGRGVACTIGSAKVMPAHV